MPARRRDRVLLLSVASSASMLLAVFATAPRADGEAFETYQLSNGARVVLAPDPRLPTATILVKYHVGARQETVGHAGLAHFLEHLTFRGDWPAGWSRGDNATTNFDGTQYFATTRDHVVAHGLWAQRWRMSDSVHHVGSLEFEREREVVKNERRERLEIRPYGKAEERLYAALFPKPHPYGARVIGYPEDLDALTLDDARRYFDAWYAPNNATIVIAGAFDRDEGRERITEYFASLPARRTPPVPPLPLVPLAGRQVIHEPELVATHPRALVAWRSPARFDEGDAAAEVLAEILGGLRASRLRSGVAEAAVSWAQQESYLAGSVFRVGLEPREGVALDDLVAGVDAAVDALAGPKPPTAGEIEAAVRIILAQRFRSYESSVARAVFLADVAPFLEGKKPLAFEQARFAAVTPDAVQRVVREYLQKERSVVILSEPPAKVAR